MTITLSDGFKALSIADWAPDVRAGNAAATSLAQQHAAMLDSAGGPMAQVWDSRETVIDGAVGPIFRCNIPDVAGFRISVVAEYTGAEGDGGTVAIIWADSAGTDLGYLGAAIDLVNGVSQYVWECRPGAEVGEGYHIAVEWGVKAGETATHHGTCISPMVLTSAPASTVTDGGSIYIEDEETASKEALSVDLMRRMLAAPTLELAARCSHYLQHWGVDGSWTAIRSRYLAASFTTAEEWKDIRIRSTGKKFKVLVRGYGVASGGTVAVTIDGVTATATVTGLVAPATYVDGWYTGTSATANVEGYHSMNVLIAPPTGSTLYLLGVTVYEVTT